MDEEKYNVPINKVDGKVPNIFLLDSIEATFRRGYSTKLTVISGINSDPILVVCSAHA